MARMMIPYESLTTVVGLGIFKRLLWRCCALTFLTGQAFGQMLTADQVVETVLRSHPQMRAAALEVSALQMGERAAGAWSGPELNLESPTGTFYALGVTQRFDFPAVYKNRKSVARAETSLASALQELTANELRYAVRVQFLELQVATTQLDIMRRRDSVFQKIQATADRQFAAGQIDGLQHAIAVHGAGRIKRQLLAAEQTMGGLREQLEIWTGISGFEDIEPLQTNLSDPLTESGRDPRVLYQERVADLARQQVALAKNQTMPGFSVGYLNQGDRQTPAGYRFRASIEIPIWVGQNKGIRERAATAALAAEQRSAASAQEASLERVGIQTEIANARVQLENFEAEGLPQMRLMVETAMRMQIAGQLDYGAFLRTLDAAFAVETDYVDQLESFHSALIRLRFLEGN